MKNFFSIVFSLYACTYVQVGNTHGLRKHIASGDIAGRKLIIPGLGWTGHVGLGTGDQTGLPTELIIETLRENPVIQFNSHTDFKSRSEYWGSRSGIGDYASGTYAALREGFEQSWWCPGYSDDTSYIIGAGYLRNNVPIPTKCGRFRCDTFVAWVFYKAGYSQIMNNRIMLPLNVWYTFPIFNNDTFVKNIPAPISTPNITEVDKQFDELTAQELNDLPYEKFSEIGTIPSEEETPTHRVAEWRFAKDKNVHPTKRGIFIDRLAISQEPHVITSFLDMLKIEKNDEVKRKLIEGTMFYYQNHWEQVKDSTDYEILKTFYHDLLKEKLSNDVSPTVLRGYIDFHSGNEIIHDKLFMSLHESYLNNMEPRMALGLYHELSFKSPTLEPLALQSMVKFVQNHHRSDLEGMFFGITNLKLQDYKNPKSITIIKNYIKSIKTKYTNMKFDEKDLYAGVASQEHNELQKSLKMNKN